VRAHDQIKTSLRGMRCELFPRTISASCKSCLRIAVSGLLTRQALSSHSGFAGGLVREEDVYGPGVIDPEDVEFFSRLPTGPVKYIFTLARPLFMRPWSRALCSHASSRIEGTCTQSAPLLGGQLAASEATFALEDALVFIEGSLTLMGILLLAIVPSTICLYTLLERDIQWPVQLRHVGSAFQLALAPLDWALSPMLAQVASLLGYPRSDVRSENIHGPEVVKRARRVLLGLVLLNVFASASALLAILCLVFVVKAEGSPR